MRKDLSIYIHIPFCVKKCIYCDFLSFGVEDKIVGKSGVVRKSYLSSLCHEMASYKAISKDYIIRTIYIGGGTPSILLPGEVGNIMAYLKSTFKVAEDAEVSIEVNPGTLTRLKADEYLEAGINRMSIGLQSANNYDLNMLGRIHNYDQFLASYLTAREAGFKNINIDIMSAIPGQTLHTYLETVEKVLKCKPEHISAYSLIVEEGTPLASRDDLLSKLPSESLDREMYEATRKVLEMSGYKRYEISNYAKVGYACKHNEVYWSMGEYLGIGLGASSFFNGRRYSNTRDIFDYIDAMDSHEDADIVENSRTVEENLTIENMMEEYVILGLRKTAGISAEEFHSKFNRSIYDVFGDVIDKYVSQGFMENDGGIIRLNKKGIDVSNTILAEFLL